MLLLIDLFGVCMEPYEILLAGLGVILFIAAIVFTGLKRDGKLLIAMYILSVIMIAFPALTKIVFANVTLEVQRLQCINNKLAQSPTDTTLQEAARKKIEDIKKAGADTTNASTCITLAKTNALLGDSVKAIGWIDKGLKSNAANAQLSDFRKQLLTPRVNLELQINKVQENPADSEALHQLKAEATKLQSSPEKNTHVFTTLSKANILLKDTVRAKLLVDSALKINPANAEAKKIQRNLLIRVHQ